MSELEKAKQIAAEAFNFKSKAYTTIEQQNEIIEVNRKAFMQILSLSSLTIPKSIADKLDKDDANNKTVLDWVFATEMIVINDEEELKRREDEILRRRAIVSIYGDSKALGVDLVKVVEE